MNVKKKIICNNGIKAGQFGGKKQFTVPCFQFVVSSNLTVNRKLQTVNYFLKRRLLLNIIHLRTLNDKIFGRFYGGTGVVIG